MKLPLWISLAGLVGCQSVMTKYTKTGSFEAASRGADCEFAVFTSAPDQHAKEIGYIEFHNFVAPNDRENGVRIGEIKTALREKVCAAGGNGLLLRNADANGNFTSGTVVWLEK